MPSADEELQAGNAFQRQGRFADAEAAYRRVLASQPDHPWAIHMLGLCAQQQNRDDEAERLLRQSLALSGDNRSFTSTTRRPALHVAK